jgi:hypothetical protein
VFLNQGFPVCDPDLKIARAILHEEIAHGQAEGLTLDNGKILSFILVYAYPYSQLMNKCAI